MSFLRVRHAKVAVEGVCYGQHDVETQLTAEQAAEPLLAQLAERRSRAPSAPPIERVVASPWARARDLATVVAARLEVPCAIDARIAELSFGEWEGRRWDELERTDGARLSAWMANYTQLAPPGGETLAALVARVHSFMSDAAERPWLVVTHAGPMRVMRAKLRGVDYPAVALEAVAHLVIEP
jgi:alpha-ribazole phosphatase